MCGVLAPGVQGFAFGTRKYIYIPLLMAVKEGSGDVGRFLDSLSPRCRIVDVKSDRLKGMLVRRGWKAHVRALPRTLATAMWDDDEDFVEDGVDVWAPSP